MKKFVIFLAVFLLFVFAAVNAFRLVPAETYARAPLIDLVKANSGLDLKINGPMSLRFIPTLALRAEGAVVSNPTAAGATLIDARAIEVRTALMPLIWGERRFERVRLIDPKITLGIDKDGRPSWFVPGATRSAPAAGAGPGVAELLMTGATVVYRDALTGFEATIEKADATIRDAGMNNFAEAVVTGLSGTVTDGRGGTATRFDGPSVTVRGLQDGKLGEVLASASAAVWRNEKAKAALVVEQMSARIASVTTDGAVSGPVSLGGSTLTWRDETGAGSFRTRTFTADAKTVAGARLGEVTVKTDDITAGDPGRAGSSPATAGTSLEQVAITAPVLAFGAPLDASVAFLFNKERVAGIVKLASPEALMAGPAIPAAVSLAAANGTVDFDGTIVAGDAAGLKGRTKAATGSLEALSKWLRVPLPAGAVGPASLAGDIDARLRRFAVSNGRFEHGPTAMTGSVSVDLSGARPSVRGTLAADKFDADRYIGGPAPRRSAPTRSPQPTAVPAAQPVDMKDILKAYFQAMLDAPIRRNGGLDDFEVAMAELANKPRPNQSQSQAASPRPLIEWSEEKLDFDFLKAFDLDLDLAVKSLSLRGFDIAVPRLKTVMKDGALQLEGKDIATRGGRLTGKAEVDTRQRVPYVSTSFVADGLDVVDLFETFGVQPVLAGASNVTVNLSGSGTSQKELVQTLSGEVKSQIPRGAIVGHDLSNPIAWYLGGRQYNSNQRTPITGLDANLTFDKGVARESSIKLDGPVIGAQADGTIRLVEQEIDYRARLRLPSLTSFFRYWSFHLFGEWSNLNYGPDVSRYARSPSTETSPVEMLSGFDITDPELASLIGRALDRAGARGLDPAVASSFRLLQQRAQGAR